jgi:Raf kinase inhibitor-like YbhB/YbcL family protein
MHPMRVGYRWPRAVATVVVLATAAVACAASATPGIGSPHPTTPEASPVRTSSFPDGFILTSTAFVDGAPIPSEYSCRGQDVSPSLLWRGVPAGAGALVLFVDDPDGRDWVHWSVLDLPALDGSLARGVPATADPPRQGRNGFGRVGYGGPCPPSGIHRYRFTLFALAAPLGLPGHPDGATVRAALARATVLGQVTLVGTFRA